MKNAILNGARLSLGTVMNAVIKFDVQFECVERETLIEFRPQISVHFEFLLGYFYQFLNSKQYLCAEIFCHAVAFYKYMYILYAFEWALNYCCHGWRSVRNFFMSHSKYEAFREWQDRYEKCVCSCFISTKI